MLVLDGSFGEGGGQIVRTALTLSMITGTPFRIENVRANRKKPGLLRQHLTCVTAAKAITHAKVTGADLGSAAFTFTPGHIRGGGYDLAIGSAGSTALVFQTIFPALLCANEPSHVTLSGGTHNKSAPTFDYLDHVFLPLVRRMGASAEITMHKAGFYPAGGGSWHADINPAQKLTPLVLEEAGALKRRAIVADVANIGIDVAKREAKMAAGLMSWPGDTMQWRTVKAEGQGNVIAIYIEHENICEIFTGFGARNVSAEAVAAQAADEARSYIACGAPVGPHLADQLLLPMALASGGSFSTCVPTGHTRTNAAVIEKFLPVEIGIEPDGHKSWRVSITS
ncbi:MAG: RNA 3'-terminal phosphate cyclase [Hyphomicrobium sp.]|nr:RNA 3'-terminal phosphate cyclase [Hyphomicrobium sp.]